MGRMITSMCEGADILLIVAEDGRDDYGAYTAEILAMEGLSIDMVPLDRVDWQSLPAGVVLAPDLPLTAPEARALRSHAEAGGRVVFLLPHPHGAAEFGLAPTYRTSVEGILRIDIPGFVDSPVQYHAALRSLALPPEAEVCARAFAVCGADAQDGDPALARLPLGQGEAWFFLYDLPRNIALTRQGDPRRAGLHGNLVAPGWRPADMFAGHLDLEYAHLPQADIQCHLLRHILCSPSSSATPPIPFVWHFPDGAPSVLLVTSDDDWSTPEQFVELHDALESAGATATWYLVKETRLTRERVEEWQAEGHTFSIHANMQEPLRRTWRETVETEVSAFRSRFGRAPGVSVRHHAIPWIGYVQGARWDAAAGFPWDSNYFTVPPLTRHYMTGGGLPLPLVDVTGEVLPVMQAPAQFSDETTLAAGGFEFSLQLNDAEAIELLSGILHANAVDHHSLLCINTHPVSFATYSRALWEAVLSEADRLAVPRMGLDTFAAWWEVRRGVRIGAAKETAEGWERVVVAPDSAGSIEIAFRCGGGAAFAWDGVGATVARRTVHGAEYAFVRLPNRAGVHRLVCRGC